MADISSVPLPATAIATRYDAVARALHWSMALLILAAFALGLTIDDFPRAWKLTMIELHKGIGIAILLLLGFRLIWRLAHRPPPVEGSALLGVAAKLGHAALYLLMALIPIIGLVYSVRRGQSFDFGLFSLPALQAPEPREVTRPIREIHEWAAFALIGLAGLHAVAALWHHLIRKDDTLRRMLPGR